MESKQGKKFAHYNDFVSIGILSKSSRGCFDYEKLKIYIQRLDIDIHYIQNGTVECIRKNDFWRIASLALKEAYMGDDSPDVVKQQYEGQLLTKKRVAEILGNSTRTIDRLIARGDLEAIKLGDSKQSSIRVTGASLDLYLSQVQ